jgi:hypothetical protein
MHRYKKTSTCKATAPGCAARAAVSDSAMVCRPLPVVVAAALLAAPLAHAESPDDQFLALLSKDGVTVNDPHALIGIAHQRCSDNALGREQGLMPRLGWEPSPYDTAVRGLESRLMAEGLAPPQVGRFMQDAVSVYCPEQAG